MLFVCETASGSRFCKPDKSALTEVEDDLFHDFFFFKYVSVLTQMWDRFCSTAHMNVTCHEVSIHSQHSDFIQSFSLHLPLTEVRRVQCFTYVCKTNTVEISKQQLVVNAHIKDKMNKSELRMKQVKQH